MNMVICYYYETSVFTMKALRFGNAHIYYYWAWLSAGLRSGFNFLSLGFSEGPYTLNPEL